MEEEKIYLEKEQALKIAKFNDGQIHCFLSTNIALIGADHSKESFMEDLEKAETIEVGGKLCRAMNHALVLWLNGEPHFFEHNEEELKKVLGIENTNEQGLREKILNECMQGDSNKTAKGILSALQERK